MKFFIENDVTEKIEKEFEAESTEKARELFKVFINEIGNLDTDFNLLDENKKRIAFATITANPLRK